MVTELCVRWGGSRRAEGTHLIEEGRAAARQPLSRATFAQGMRTHRDGGATATGPTFLLVRLADIVRSSAAAKRERPSFDGRFDGQFDAKVSGKVDRKADGQAII